MTEIAFHFNVPNKVEYACRLLRKVVHRGFKVMVVAPNELLPRLDAALWSFDPVQFLPHSRLDDDAALVNASPVLLTAALPNTPDSLPHHQVLVNLADPVPAGFEQFERLIEVISLDESDRQLGRQRWRHYAHRGYAIVKHELTLTEAA